jgi:hypothetical protein
LIKDLYRRTISILGSSQEQFLYNVDGTLNQGGSIQEEVDLIMHFKDHSERVSFAVCDLGDKVAIVGHTWLYNHNPEINWQTGEVRMSRCLPQCHFKVQEEKKEKERRRKKESRKRRIGIPLLLHDEEEEERQVNWNDGERIFVAFIQPEQEINATQNVSQRLAEETLKTKPRKEFDELVPKEYHSFKDVFSKESFDALPQRKSWDHAIELKPGSEPHSTKVYPLAPNEQVQLDEFLAENLKSGRIRPSKSPMASPVFFVKKKDGSLRLVQDYRKLNEMTIKNSYPLPLISELVTKLRKARWYTKLDVRWGYNNVRIKEGDEWKAAFRTSRGLFEPLVMFFGLTNSPATFQTMMNDLFRELIDEGVVIVYLDDILIYTETMEEHQRVVKRVLEILRKNNLYLKAEKCEFEKIGLSTLDLSFHLGR